MRNKRLIAKGFLTSATLSLGSAVIAMGTLAFVETEAKAQMIGPCPSPIMPPPCIIFDYKRLAELSQEHAQQVQRLQEMVKHAQEAKQITQNLGGSVGDVLSIRGASDNITIGGQPFSTLMNGEKTNIASQVQVFSNSMYDNTDTQVSDNVITGNRRKAEEAASNVDAYALSLQAKKQAEDSHKRMVCLGRASQSSQDQRGDWAINSQVKVEVLRQQVKRDELMTVFLQNASTNVVRESNVAIGETVVLGRTNDAPPVPARDPAWEKRDRMRTIETAIRSGIITMAIAGGIELVKGDAKSVQDRYANVETNREQALNNFRNAAGRWNRGGSRIIVDATVAELNRIDTQMASLRQRPIEQLDGAFRERNIDAAKMMENDVDPRQFLWTWGDPMKNKITLDMANNLLRGQLDRYIDGDADNDEYRRLLISYNDARLEEAWMRTYASEAKIAVDQMNVVAAEESERLGYPIATATVQKNLQELIAEANRLGQEIQGSGNAEATEQARAILASINAAVNPQDPATQVASSR